MIDDSIRFSLARVSFGARHHHGTERERERERERSREKEREKDPSNTTHPKAPPLFWKERKVLREEKRVLSNHKKKTKKNSKRDESLGFLFSLGGTDLVFFFFFLVGFFQTVFCRPKFFSLSKRRTVDRKYHQNTNCDTPLETFLRYYPISSRRRRSRRSSGVVTRFLSPSVSLSLYFVKGKKKKKRKRADDDADDVSRNDFVVVLLHGCNEN